MLTKFAGVYPVTRLYKSPQGEAMYTTPLMSTGPTFGTISALCGLSLHIIDRRQYSILVACVIGSAVIPMLLANALYLPKHLLSNEERDDERAHRSRRPGIISSR